ncbi:MAG: trigger factor, partial [Flavobacteriales bacterium]
MDITQEKVDELNAILKVKIDPEDYKDRYDKALKDYKKNIDLRGFRKGKIPKGIVQKKYGKAIMAEEVNKILNEKVQEYIKENDLNILASPIPKEENNAEQGTFKPENPESLEFQFELGFSPEININLENMEKVEYHKIDITDDMIDKQIKDLTRQHGTLNEVEKAGENDLLTGKFTELDEEGNEKENGITHTSSISLEELQDEESKKQLTGIKNGETVELDPHKLAKGEADLSAMLN